jgi:hypothetical protein
VQTWSSDILDTSLEAARVQFAVLKRLGPAGRAQLTFELSDGLRQVVADGVRHRHPDFTEEEVCLEVLRLTLGEHLFRQVLSRKEWAGMMSQQDLLRRQIPKLEQAGIAYMVAGSLSSSFHGEARATNDIDVVIAPTAEQLESLLASFDEDYYVSPEAARAALRNRSMFNVIDLASGSKVDLILQKDRPFSQEEFSRRRPVALMGTTALVASPEDTILSKLEWAKMGSSERQLRDARGVAALQWDRLDVAYLRRWAPELGVTDQLEQVLREAEQLQ